MNKIIELLLLLFRHILNQISNYLLILGVLLILFWVFSCFGTLALILSVGIICIIVSAIIELNKNNKPPKTLY